MQHQFINISILLWHHVLFLLVHLHAHIQMWIRITCVILWPWT